MLETNSLAGVLAFFFYEHGYLSIPEFGRLQLSGDSSPQMDENHLHVFPKGSISFISNPSEKPDTELIEYITSRTRKMKTLAISDLTFISDSAKEMLNMRQSYTFPGIATIAPDPRGGFIVIPEKLLSAPHPSRKQVTADLFGQDSKGDIPQENEIHSSGGHRTFGGTIIAVVCVLVVIALVYFLFLHKAGNASRIVSNTNDTIVPGNSVSREESRHPVKGLSPDTVANYTRESAISDRGLLNYEVVFEQADSARAFRRYNQLTGWGHKIIIKTKDSVNYTLAVSITSPVADTAAIKDSLRIFYGRPVYIRYLSPR